MTHLCPITPWVGGQSVPGPRPGHARAQLCKQPGHLGERGAGSRMAAPAPGEVTRPLQSSSNYVSDTRSHKQTPDTSCLFLDWKSLFLPAQVVKLERAEHQWRQRPHSHPQRDSANHPPSTFRHPLPLPRRQRIRAVCCIAAEKTTRSSPDTLTRGAGNATHCSATSTSLGCSPPIGPNVRQRWFGNFKKRK